MALLAKAPGLILRSSMTDAEAAKQVINKAKKAAARRVMSRSDGHDSRT